MASKEAVAGAFKRHEERRRLNERAAAMGAFVHLRFRKGYDKVSPAHNWGHVQRVATYAPEIVRALGGTAAEAEVARTAGYMHDLVRLPTETETHGGAGARMTKEVFARNAKGPFGFTDTETALIANAITKHESPPALLKTANKDNPRMDAIDRIQLAIWIADKLEANGQYVMARRAGFVGGERVREGDLAKKGFKPQDAALAVALESYIRLNIKNDQTLYPKYFLPVVDEMFNVQRDFYYALLKELGLTEEQVAKLVVEKGMAKKEEVDKTEAKRADTRKLIAERDADSAKSALELVNHFSSEKWYRRDLKESIAGFRPRNKKAREWKAGMERYMRGGLASDIRKKIRLVEAESPPVTARREREFYSNVHRILAMRW
ncbi:MAG: HD domain-containing protein [Candidatus Micrarchaeia archaeon]